MPPAFTRDVVLDQNLESEARLTLILVAAGLGVLVLATVVVFFGYRLLGFFRLPFSASTQPATTEDTAEKPETETASVASTDKMMPASSQPHSPAQGQATNVPKSKIPFLLTSIRKHSSAPHRPTGLYPGLQGSPFPRPSKPGGSVGVGFESPPTPPHMMRTAYGTTRAVPQGVVTPHAAGWMKVADAVVGRHPDAKPLCNRVATQTDIDLISGHLHMPWAFNDKARNQPRPVKVLRPDTACPAPVFPPVSSEVLKDVGNTRSRVVLVSVNNGNSNKHSKRTGKGKGKSPRSAAYGKENMPVGHAAASSSLPVSSGRRT